MHIPALVCGCNRIFLFRAAQCVIQLQTASVQDTHTAAFFHLNSLLRRSFTRTRTGVHIVEWMPVIFVFVCTMFLYASMPVLLYCSIAVTTVSPPPPGLRTKVMWLSGAKAIDIPGVNTHRMRTSVER